MNKHKKNKKIETKYGKYLKHAVKAYKSIGTKLRNLNKKKVIVVKKSKKVRVIRKGRLLHHKIVKKALKAKAKAKKLVKKIKKAIKKAAKKGNKKAVKALKKKKAKAKKAVKKAKKAVKKVKVIVKK